MIKWNFYIDYCYENVPIIHIFVDRMIFACYTIHS